jgi:hypothetical protein
MKKEKKRRTALEQEQKEDNTFSLSRPCRAMDSTPRDCFSAMLCRPPISNAMEGEYEYDQKSSLSPRVFAGQGQGTL